MIELLLVVIAILLACICTNIRVLRKLNYLKAGMIAEMNGWDSKKVVEIYDKFVDS